MKTARLIVNPNSGDGNNKAYIDKIQGLLEGAFDQVDVEISQKEGDAKDLAKKATQDQIHSLFILGGDGTYNEVLNGLAGQAYRPKVGLLPGGTNNTFYQLIGGSNNLDEALDRLDFNRLKMVDLGLCNGRYFSYYVCFGRLIEATTSTGAKEKEALGPLAYVKNMVQALPQDQSYQVKIESDGGSYEGPASHVFVLLVDRLGNLDFSQQEGDLNSGHLHVFILTDAKTTSKFTALKDMLFGRLNKSDAIKAFTCTKLSIKELEGREVDLDLDEEVGPKLPAKIEILPSYLNIYLPAPVNQ